MSKESKALEKKASQAWTSKRVFDMILNNALIIIMVIAVIYIAIRNPNFIRKASIINILSQTCAYLPVALGIGGCIVLTGTDLSAGRIVGLTACVSASLLQAVTASSKDVAPMSPHRPFCWFWRWLWSSARRLVPSTASSWPSSNCTPSLSHWPHS